MFKISLNDIITITRGDTGLIDLVINLGTALEPLIYDLGSQDKIYLGICEPNAPFERAIVRKVYTSSDYDYKKHVLTLKLDSIDTEFLLPGTYSYSIKLYRPALTTTAYKPDPFDREVLIPYELKTAEKIDTIIDRKKFIIIE